MGKLVEKLYGSCSTCSKEPGAGWTCVVGITEALEASLR